MRKVLIGSDGSENVARLKGSGSARRSGAQCDVLQGHEQTLALDVGKAEVDDAGVGVVGVPVEDHVGKVGRELVHELLAETLHVLRIVLHLLQGELASSA